MIKFIQANTRKQAQQQAPWAAKIVKVCGGYQAFEFMSDYQTWKNQK